MIKQTHINNQKGIATMESTLLLAIFVVFMTYCVGFFGVVHTGILNSISSRAYAFEIFRNRTNLTYFRDVAGNEPLEQFNRIGYRAHGVLSEKASGEQTWFVTERKIAMGRESPEVTAQRNADNFTQTRARETTGVNPVWIKTTYGICLNTQCGDQ